jgi:hypothetical protein
MEITIVFVHGYSVTNFSTYGELPLRLRTEGQLNGIEINVKEIFLGRYISFNDEVTLDDISRALDTAIKDELEPNQRFVCITHSTGGPVVRDWWNKFIEKNKNNPSAIPQLSHLIMLAPANFGSTLAQLGKGRLSRIKSWFDGVEPGQKVLDWLELGSFQAWNLNKKWIESNGSQLGVNGVFPFVITGQSIDRKLFDHLNPYTGELGTDGVLRTASCNLNAQYLKLSQKIIEDVADKKITITNQLELADASFKASPRIPLRIVKGKSHSGSDMGIMNSIKKDADDQASKETINAILRCIKVVDTAGYEALTQIFANETAQVQKEERVEIDKEMFVFKRTFIHDRFSQIIFRITDSQGLPVKDFDLIFTGGENNDPNHLPEGFIIDKQRNKNNNEILTYYFNYDAMDGTPDNQQLDALTRIGFQIKARPNEGFVRFVDCSISASSDLLSKVLQPNTTTMIDIVIQRVVSKEVFKLKELVGDEMPSTKAGEFSNTKPGKDIVK